jgi:hypothetical protein
MKRSLAIVACLVAAGMAGATPAAPTILPEPTVLAGAEPIEPTPPDGEEPPKDAEGKSGMTCCFD